MWLPGDDGTVAMVSTVVRLFSVLSLVMVSTIVRLLWGLAACPFVAVVSLLCPQYSGIIHISFSVICIPIFARFTSFSGMTRLISSSSG
jgi:hypothetical protein